MEILIKTSIFTLKLIKIPNRLKKPITTANQPFGRKNSIFLS